MTTPTTQREADERASTPQSLGTLEFMANAQAWARAYSTHDMAEERRQWRIMVDCLNEQVRAAIDQSTRQAAPDMVRTALDKLLERYVSLVNSGDAGFWDVETDDEVITARAALAAATDQPSAGLPAKTWEQSPYLPNYYESQAWARGWNDARASLTPTAPQAASQQAPDDVKQAVRDAVAGALSGLYYCGRVWSAWSVGTMSEDDFSPADEDDDIIENVTDAAMNAMVLASVSQGAPQAATTAACQPSTLTGQPDAAICQPAATTASASRDYDCYNCGGKESSHNEGCPAIRAQAPSQSAPLAELFAAIDEAQRMNHYNESSFQLGVRVARLKCLADDVRAALARAPLPAQQVQAVDVARDAVPALQALRAEVREMKDNLETFGPYSQEAAGVAIDGVLDVIDEHIAMSRTNTTGGNEE